MFGIGWPSIIIFVFILLFFAATARASFEAVWGPAREAPMPSRLGQVAAVVIAAIICVQLDVLAVHGLHVGLHVLKNRAGGWDGIISFGGATSFCGLVLAFLWWTFLGDFFHIEVKTRFGL
jgi:formate hydrogenlyase subunit 3/multisubunit Na+/H+ antiporter MnhD subunit